MADFQEVSYNSPVEGELTNNQTDESEVDDGLSTIDEPVRETIVSSSRHVCILCARVLIENIAIAVIV